MIVDVSYFNRPVPWPALRAAGVTCVIVRGPIGAGGADFDFPANWVQAKTFPRQGIYGTVNRTQSAAAHVTNYLKVCGGDYGTEPLALDVERTNAERAAIAAGTLVWDKVAYTALLRSMLLALAAHTRDKVYTSKVEWEAMTTSPAWALSLPLWVAHYNSHITEPDCPAGWDWDLWQFGQAVIGGKTIDVNRENVKPMPDTLNRGCLLGGHTQGPSSIIPIYAVLKAKGARLKFIISDEDGGKMIEAQVLGVETRINRKHLPETGPNHWMEGGGDADVPLSAQQKQDYINAAVALPYKASPTEFKATTHFQVTGNEYERNTPQQWLDYLDLILQVIIQGKQRSTHDKAVMMGISDAEAATLSPVRYAFPVFNAGSPHTWEMYQAIAEHPIWPIVQAEGHLLLCHEGIGFDQPFDFGENQPVEPGKPMAPGAGLVNFRIYNLLWLLWQKGIRVKWGAGEWYDGRRPRDHQVPERVANMIRHDNLLASSPFAADCVGYGQFQFDNNPTSPWYEQDATLLWQMPEWQAHVVEVSDRINGIGDDEMQPLFHAKALKDLTIRDAAGNPTTDPVGDLPIPPATGSVVRAGTIVHVYALNVTAGPLTNRAAITADGKSIWNVAGCLQKI